MTDTPVRIVGVVNTDQPRILPETGSWRHAVHIQTADRAWPPPHHPLITHKKSKG